MAYFTTPQRRDALERWLRREYGTGYFNAAEASEAKDIFTPLYGRDAKEQRRVSADLAALRRAGKCVRVRGHQWQMIEQNG